MTLKSFRAGGAGLSSSATGMPSSGARFSLSVEQLAILASLYFSLTSNYLFFKSSLAGRDPSSPHTWLFAAAIFVAITALHAAGLFVLMNRWTAKPLLAILLVVTSLAVYYMNKYTVFYNTEMVRNVFKTDVKEASELLSFDMLLHVLLFAGLPILVIWRIPLRRRPWHRAIPIRLLYIVGALLLAAASIMSVFQDFSSLMRNHKEIRFLITPSNYLFSTAKLLSADSSESGPRIPISTDAKLEPSWAKRTKPMLFVLVVGETTRGRDWGLNGYARQTTPQLSKLDVINFPDAHSCGTNTEVSVPCMFSPYGRHDYNEKAIRTHESFLHILNHVGIRVLWRDNQAGCKGVCDGLHEDRLDDSKDPQLCNSDRCLDEIMLKGLDAEIRKDKVGNIFVVLHQLGSHGPAYYQRYPASLRKFTPTCDTADLSKCSREQIVNSYDNSVLYTDDFLAKTIAFLKSEQKDYDTAMWYMSDHGESLGENGIYLHGMPYPIAPQDQTHIPMVMWFSDGFLSSFDLNRKCLEQETHDRVSHDDLFSTILGMLQIQSKYYDKSYDLTANCHR